MKRGIIHKILLCGIMILFAENISAQILKDPDPKLVVDREKAILIINPCIKGSLFLNDFLMTDIPANDTAFIFNVKPGEYLIKFITDSLTYKGEMTLEKGKIQTIIPCHDSISLPANNISWNGTFRKMTGQTIHLNRVRRSSFYNITQFALFNFYLDRDGGNASTTYFQSFTIINGYQVAPGFCTGIGVSYNYYPFDIMTSWEVEIENVRLNFLPIFLDVRAHLPPKGKNISPFFKFNIGYNLLLYKPPLEELNPGGDTFVMNKGGIYISPGFGLRIFINDLVQIVTTLEYSFEKSSFYVNNPYQAEPYTRENNFSFLKISLGVGFQYK